MSGFLPVSKEDMAERGWYYLDFICVTGDAYVDHPSFGPAIISRVLESEGFKVGIIAQPDWKTTDGFQKLGRPRYGFLVSSGNIDSMVNHYTAAKKPRAEDFYSPGGKPHCRPDRTVTVYTQKIKEAYPDVPVIIGGLEASLRRFAHYDYWDDRVRPSILMESGADLLVYGMGERQTAELSNRLRRGENISGLTDIRGTCYLSKNIPAENTAICPSCERVSSDKAAYAKSCRIQYEQQDAVTGKTVAQDHGGVVLIQNPPALPLNTQELDRVYSLPYMRAWHPVYDSQGGVPAIQEVEFSITHNRGCFGACNFCAISFHQGRMITSRSRESVLEEAQKLIEKPNFKGYIHDVGGPTANFRKPSCKRQLAFGLCKGKKCLAPVPCKNLEVDHREYLDLLRSLRSLPGVKKVFVRSGLRYDYMMEDPDDSFFRELVKHHVSGQLKVAPEHCSAAVLDRMGKPHIETYVKFMKKFYDITKKAGREQYLVPYLMSSHPGSTLKEAVELALFLKKEHIRPEQVQDFYPTPGTVSTCMFYTGLDPFTMKKVYVPRTPGEKAMQRALLQYFKPENRRIVLDALRQAGRTDLIGFSGECLVRPDARAQTNVRKPQIRPAEKRGGHPKGKKKRGALGAWQGKRNV
ncbi:MAG TPA: YgiQ family radical SAM protein [Clostridia bacterium]|nr:YgiQ family radical SAM protein [Clostridia bacterium]